MHALQLSWWVLVHVLLYTHRSCLFHHACDKLRQIWHHTISHCCSYQMYTADAAAASARNIRPTKDQYSNAVKWPLPLGTMLNDNIKAGQKILKRSGVCPSGHMDSSGVASACNLDTRSQTFTWMGLNVSVCVCVCMCLCMHMCHSGSMCPFVRGPWHLLMKKSSQRVLPWLQAALLPRESFSPVCHIGCWSL